MVDRQSVEALKWLVHISANKKIIHAGKGGKSICNGYEVLKSMGTVRRPRMSLSILDASTTVAHACLIGTNQLARLRKVCLADMRKRWLDCRK
jgi:hypothetical protein